VTTPSRPNTPNPSEKGDPLSDYGPAPWPSAPPQDELLTAEELELMDVLCDAANRFRRILGASRTTEGDWAEIADKIHQLQTMVMAQAAGRRYPELFRLLGGTVRPLAPNQEKRP
jgi:hypothetical protein